MVRPSAHSDGKDRSPTRLGGLLDVADWSSVVQELGLSPQQVRIVELILQGKRDKEIARELGLRLSTVRAYLGRVFDRVGVRDRVELILRVIASAQSHRKSCGRRQE